MRMSIQTQFQQNTGAMLTNVLRNVPGMVSGVNNTLLAQHVSEVTYTEIQDMKMFSGTLMDTTQGH